MSAITLFALLFVLTTLIALLFISRPQRIVVEASGAEFEPASGFPHDAFEALLKQFVSADGYVDYTGWHDDASSRQQLRTYLAGVARYSPVNAPQRFPSNRDALAYWMYAYNAYVVWSVLEKWPLDSVTDVAAPLEIVKGFGFFYRRRFSFGGRSFSLYNVENEIIRKQFLDPRIHFVLNCASESCPALRPELPTGDDLDAFLERSTQDFIGDPGNVEIDPDERRIRLSAIFRMYESDFVDDLRSRGLPSDRGPVAWVEAVASNGLRDKLIAARDYPVEYREFDWALNKQ